MKVAHVTTIDASLRYLLLHQMQAIQAEGHEVFGISSDGEDVQVLVAGGIGHFSAPLTRAMRPLADLRALVALTRIMRREKFTVVHTHTPKGGLLGQYAALFAGVPVRVHTIHGLYVPGHASPRARFVFIALERITMLFSQHNFSQNPEDIPTAIREKISAPEKLELIGNGIDISAFDPALYSAEARAEKRRSLGLTPEHLVVGMVARLVTEKGYREMFQAAREIKAREPRARFVFIGQFEPDKPDAIEADALRENGIDDVAQFLGHRNDVPELLSTMDVLTLPSYREGFPRSVMEGAAMGMPTVVTDIRGCRQTVEDGVTGIVIPAKDASALARALLSLLADPVKRAEMGKAGREKALREFDERVVFERILRRYRTLLERVRTQPADVKPCVPGRPA